MTDWEDFATRMASMARDLLAQDSVDATLERITASAVELVAGCDAAGILVLRDRRVQTLAPTEDLVLHTDKLQEREQEGPCFDLARLGGDKRIFRIKDLTTEDNRWPGFATEACDLGVGSMMGFLLYTEDEELGALNLYAHRPAAFTSVSETSGWLLASHAAVALSSARNAAQLHHALDTRHTIGEALGIVMERHGLSQNDAFDVLRRLSQERNVKLREIARRICETGTTDD